MAHSLLHFGIGLTVQALSVFIGRRYLRARRQNSFISFISMISMAGIALGVAALIVVLSVMNGFQKEVRASILGVTSHVQIRGFEEGLDQWEPLAEKAARQSGVNGVAPFINGQGLIILGQVARGVEIRGIDPQRENQVTTLDRDMRFGKLGDLVPGEFGIVLGADLAQALQAPLGSKIQVLIPQSSVTPAGMVPRSRRFTVVGIFRSGHSLYDLNLALVHINDAQKLYRLDTRISGVRLKVTEIDRAPDIASHLRRTLRFDGYVTDWTQENATYFRAVQIEKRMMFIILTLIIAVAAFNLVSTLVMAVTDKHPDIAILRTLGASPTTIMQIFLVQGSLIGMAGTLAGLIGGIVMALNVSRVVAFIEGVFGFQVLSKEVYFISELPSDLHGNDVVVVALIAFFLSLVATLYPSYRAARVNPAEALRYE